MLTFIKTKIIYILFKFGDFISNTYLFNEFGIGYDLYQWLLLTSIRLQEKWQIKGPWDSISH